MKNVLRVQAILDRIRKRRSDAPGNARSEHCRAIMFATERSTRARVR